MEKEEARKEQIWQLRQRQLEKKQQKLLFQKLKLAVNGTALLMIATKLEQEELQRLETKKKLDDYFLERKKRVYNFQKFKKYEEECLARIYNVYTYQNLQQFWRSGAKLGWKFNHGRRPLLRTLLNTNRLKFEDWFRQTMNPIHSFQLFKKELENKKENFQKNEENKSKSENYQDSKNLEEIFDSFDLQNSNHKKKIRTLFDEKKRENEDLKLENSKFKKEIEELNHLKIINAKQIEEMRDQEQKTKNYLKEIEQEKNSRELEIFRMEGRISELEKRLKKQKEKIKEKNEKMIDLKEIIEKHEEAIENLQKEKNKLEEENSQLKVFSPFGQKNEIMKKLSNELEKMDLRDFENVKDVRLKQGAHAYVSKVKNKLNGKIYAMKSYKGKSSLDEIKKEISLWEILKGLSEKPNSIPIFYRAFEEENTLTGVSTFYLFFDYYPYSLKTLFEELNSTPISFNQILLYAEKLINGLAFLQTIKICHRDLKPTNLLLDESKKKFI